ncbi:hypothetical protein MRX96_017908 [Rhipicephalus microplus]
MPHLLSAQTGTHEGRAKRQRRPSCALTRANMSAQLQTADLKVIILGESNVGKTCLLVRYLEKRFEEFPKATLGAAFTLKMRGKHNIAIWDTAGQERYLGLSIFYCRNADVAIMAYDVTSRESFKALMTRYVQLLSMVDDFALKVVVGTKIDLLGTKKRQVSVAEAEVFAKSLNPGWTAEKAPYFETSSATGENIDQVFDYIFEYCTREHGLLSCCLNNIHEKDLKTVTLTPRTLQLGKTVANCCL